MKINHIYGPPEPAGKDGKGNIQKSGKDFKRILDDRLHTTPTQEVKKTATTGSVNATQAAADLRVEGLTLSERTIAKLSQYENALLDKSIANEDLEPFVKAMEDEVEGLLALQNELSEEDPLSRLLENVATVSHVEAAKYRRGDFEKV